MQRAVAGATGDGVRIAILDSGIDPHRRDPLCSGGIGLLSRQAPGCRLEPSADVADRDGHGTACAEIIHLLAPRANLHPVRVFDRRRQTSGEVLIAGLRWAVAERVDVVNLSLCTLDHGLAAPLYAACEGARRAGIVVVAAYDRRHTGSLPATFANTLAVVEGEMADVHDYLFCPQHPFDCVAHGRFRLRWLGGAERTVAASSYAAPVIAGLVALFRQVHPGAGPGEIRRLLARWALGGPGRDGEGEAGDDTKGDLR